MIAFVIRRLLQSIAVMLTVGLIAFSLFNFVGDPINNMVGQDTTLEDAKLLLSSTWDELDAREHHHHHRQLEHDAQQTGAHQPGQSVAVIHAELAQIDTDQLGFEPEQLEFFRSSAQLVKTLVNGGSWRASANCIDRKRSPISVV